MVNDIFASILRPQGELIIWFIILLCLCRLFEWDEEESDEVYKLGVKVSEKVLGELEDVGLQLALAFDSEGSTLAAGGEVEILPPFFWNTIAAWTLRFFFFCPFIVLVMLQHPRAL